LLDGYLMPRFFAVAVVAGSLIFAAAGCGNDRPATGTAGSDPPIAQKTGASTTVKVVKTRYGRILVDGHGRALYLFTRERRAASRCYGACANAWPVFFARGKVRAGTGADRRLIGTTRRKDGRRQVTYAGRPLYYYVTDRKPGQITCQNVVEYGGTWLVVAPSGKARRGPERS
jgi:predicted lipoprotein with Yx(FWY)xxD motif